MIGRALEGLALLAWLGWQYAAAHLIGRVAARPARAWRRAIDAHGARWFASYARRRGALLIKLGQFVASRPDAFPLSYVDACSTLRDQAPARSPAVIRATLDHAFEGRADRHFARVEPVPIAAASFGQVHRAWLAGDGRLVAVKVQHPDLARIVALDLALVRLALWAFAPLLPGWPLGQLYAEIARTSRDEQDYLREATASERLRPQVERFGVRVPAVLWEHTRETVLTMAFAPGETLARLDRAALDTGERRRLATALIDAFLHMLLEEGFFHADPHAGNLIWTPPAVPGQAGQLWLIDFGMVGAISPRERDVYRRFLAAMLRDDTDAMVDHLFELGVQLPGADRDDLRALAREAYGDLGHLDPRTFKGSRRQTDLAVRMAGFLRRMRGVILPQHTVMLARASGLIEGVCLDLVPGTAMVDLLRPRIAARMSWWGEAKRQWHDLAAFWREMRRLPEQVQVLRRSRVEARPTTPVITALLLIAALLLPDGTMRTIAVIVAGSALLLGILRR